MQNAKTYLIIISLSLLVGFSISYAFTDSPEVRIEKENKQAIRECLSSIDYESGTTEIQKATTACWKLELKRIVDPNILNASGGIAPVSSQIKISPDSETMDEFLVRIDMNLDKLHKIVCKKQINSPLCKDKELFGRLYHITEERLPMKQFYPILIWMTNAESSLWLDYAKDKVWGTCIGRNNWGGAKYMINDNNTRVYKRNLNWFDYTYPRDQYDCNLFPFESVEEYWKSKVNWIRYWYKGCIDSPTPIKCISFAYVWDRNTAEQSWIDNVSHFLK